MPYKTILVERVDAISLITLNRPDKLNSFNAEMHEELADALAIVEEGVATHDIRTLVITGAGRAFCCGQDLNERRVGKGEKFEAGAALEKYYNPLVRRLRGLPVPVICAVNGVAAGAGANIALSGDIVLAARSAKFIQAFSKIGLIPDAGGTYLLARQIGEMRAKALTMLATPIDAEKACLWGLVWEVFDDDVFMAEVMAMAGQLSKGATQGLALTKQAIHGASINSYSDQLDLEMKLQKKAGASADFAEGVAAFFDKRPPVFSGK